MSVAEILGCGSPTNKRRKHDFYETESRHTHALLKVIKFKINDPAIWEPCAGKGAITEVLRAYGFKVVESDLVSRRQIHRVDFLKTGRPLAPCIITNPPYVHATPFVHHAYNLGINFLALLLKADFLNTQERYELVKRVGYPTHVYGLIKRPDFTGEGAPPMVCSWFVWQRWHARSSKFQLLDNR